MRQGELSLLNNGSLNALTMVSGSITPGRHRPFIYSEDMHNRLEWATIREQSYDYTNELGWLAKSFQHRSRPSGKRPTTESTTITFSLAIMNPDIAPFNETTC